LNLVVEVFGKEHNEIALLVAEELQINPIPTDDVPNVSRNRWTVGNRAHQGIYINWNGVE
jgi:hypothetical protein